MGYVDRNVCGLHTRSNRSGQPAICNELLRERAERPNLRRMQRLFHRPQANTLRQSRRLTEEDFIAAAQIPGTIILDARSRGKYQLLHIKGAINLPFTDMTAESLAEEIRTAAPAF